MTGIIKGLDPQRRLVIPKDMLFAAGFKEGDLLEVWAEETEEGLKRVVLTKYMPGCAICGGADYADVIQIEQHNKVLCRSCLTLAEFIFAKQDHKGE